MDSLHAYWRMEYVSAPKGDSKSRNPFLDLPKLDDKEAKILFRGKTAYIVLNRYPYNAGHLMVIPFREVADIAHLTLEEQSELMQLIIKAKDILQKALKPDAFNVGFNLGAAAGGSVDMHLHCHIVPRWNGDTNFMPVIGKTRVLPTSLEAMWEGLRTFV